MNNQNNQEKFKMNVDGTLSPTDDIIKYRITDLHYQGKQICLRCIKRLAVKDNFCQNCYDIVHKFEVEEDEEEMKKRALKELEERKKEQEAETKILEKID